MGDGGLAVGAALAPCVRGIAPETMKTDKEPLRDAYLGGVFTDRDIARVLDREGLSIEPLDQPLG